MLPANMKPSEVLDLGIHGETLAYRMYDRLARCVHVPTLQMRLNQLRRDEKDHRKTLRAHRRALFPNTPPTMTEADAEQVFGTVDTSVIRDKETLIQVLYGAIRFEEYGAYYYSKIQSRVPNREARIFLEVLANEGKTHSRILEQQIEALRSLDVRVDERGRAIEIVPGM